MKGYYSFIVLVTFLLSFENRTILSQNFDPKKNFEVCADGVVLIKTPSGFGTGFFINNDGCIATNHHVLKNKYGGSHADYEIGVTLKNGQKFDVTKIDYTTDYPKLDIALLKINTYPEKVLSLSPDDDISTGEDAVAIGHPAGLEWTQTTGRITNDFEDFFQTQIPINPGNSGGSILNKNGQVIGIATLKRMDMEGTGFAIKVKKLREVLGDRRINYKTHALILLDESPIKVEWEILNKAKLEFEEEKQNISIEKKELTKEKEEFIRLKSESGDLIRLAEPISKMRDDANRKLEDISQREIKLNKNISEREISLSAKEQELNQKIQYYSYLYPNHFVLEILGNAGYYIGETIESGNILYGVSAGLLYRFDIDVKNKDEQFSNRFGIQYNVFKNYNFDKKYLFPNSQQYISVILDFSERLRFGAGIDISDQTSEFSKRQLFFPIAIYFNRGEIPFASTGKVFADQKFNNVHYSIGLAIGYGGYFFRW